MTSAWGCWLTLESSRFATRNLPVPLCALLRPRVLSGTPTGRAYALSLVPSSSFRTRAHTGAVGRRRCALVHGQHVHRAVGFARGDAYVRRAPREPAHPPRPAGDPRPNQRRRAGERTLSPSLSASVLSPRKLPSLRASVQLQALLGTGLFARAAPAPYPPTPDMGPMYVGDAASGAIRQVRDRESTLPPCRFMTCAT